MTTTAQAAGGRERGEPRSLAAALATPATLVVAIGLLVPICILFRYSLNEYMACAGIARHLGG